MFGYTRHIAACALTNRIYSRMSTAIKWIIGLIVLAALAWLVWYSGLLSAPAPVAQRAALVATTTPQQSAATTTNGMSAPADTSSAALNQDAAAIDAQVQGLQIDTTSVDASLSDKSITQ